MPSRRILYTGAGLALLASLKATLKDCRVVRSPSAVARLLIESNINYSLLLFDGELAELADFARSLSHRQGTPVFILPASTADTVEIVSAVACLLITSNRWADSNRCAVPQHLLSDTGDV